MPKGKGIEAFKEYLSQYTDVEEYFHFFLNQKKAFRVNTLKITEEKFEAFAEFEFERFPSIPHAYTSEKRDIGKTISYFLGFIHPQSLSSMLPAIVLSPKPHSKVLDVAAAPGGKTTQMSEMMRNTGIIYANDKSEERIPALVGNMERLGAYNIKIFNLDGRKLPWRECFLYALVDAPCSSLGSDLRAMERFSWHRVRDLARVNRKLIISAFDALEPGGVLVYSTCTITEKENEEVVLHLLENREASLLPVELPVPHERGLVEYGKEFSYTARVYPQHFGSEAFFIAKIKKL